MKMKLIVCTDTRGGMMFFGRRPARDRFAIADIIKDAKDKRILISPYSEKLFAEENGEYVISSDPLGEAGADDVVFIEDKSIREHLHKIDTITVYSWDLPYPFDKRFDINPEDEGFSLIHTNELKGHAHDIVTKRTYSRKK
jgi:hypothetical protein